AICLEKNGSDRVFRTERALDLSDAGEGGSVQRPVGPEDVRHHFPGGAARERRPCECASRKETGFPARAEAEGHFPGGGNREKRRPRETQIARLRRAEPSHVDPVWRPLPRGRVNVGLSIRRKARSEDRPLAKGELMIFRYRGAPCPDRAPGGECREEQRRHGECRAQGLETEARFRPSGEGRARLPEPGEGLQIERDVLRRLETGARVLLETMHHDSLERGGDGPRGVREIRRV